MNRNKATTFVIVFFIGAAIGIFSYDRFFGSSGSDEKIESLQFSIDSLEQVNKEKLIELESFQNKYDSVANLVLKSGNIIDSLKTEVTLKQQEYENKINSVDSFKHSELEEFFADRYN